MAQPGMLFFNGLAPRYADVLRRIDVSDVDTYGDLVEWFAVASI
jgi:hypothetical protein